MPASQATAFSTIIVLIPEESKLEPDVLIGDSLIGVACILIGINL